ncbi:MAG TPA: glutaredoxin family protein [Spirochaetota bacterium]|nr:glutaredoxin family protein [Spirochaetota bacterium]
MIKRKRLLFRLILIITSISIVINIPVNGGKHCFAGGEKTADIILYGNEKCGYCRETRRWLDENSIPYIYRNVELYGTYQEEMYKKLSGAGTARFPVLDIKGQMLIRPSADDIKKALRGEKVITKEVRKMKTPLWRPEKNKSLVTDFATVKPKLSVKDIILYTAGSAEGKKLAAELKKENIPFTLKEIHLMGNAAFFDLSSRLADNGFGNRIIFPIAEVRGEMIMKAAIDDIKVLVIETIAD